jgi:hypothetical protein
MLKNRAGTALETQSPALTIRPLGTIKWPWTGVRNSDGYGHLQWQDRPISAHRLAWEVANGPIPRGGHILHRCDVRACVNPAHLRLGNHTDNMRDMAAKGRGNRGETRGEANAQAKLTEQQVHAIRAMRNTATHEQLGARFGVNKVTIRDIMQRKRWRHI